MAKALWKLVEELDIVCLAASYTQEHMSSDGMYSLHGYVNNRNLLCLKFPSRNVSQKKYIYYICFKEGQPMHGIAATPCEHVLLENERTLKVRCGILVSGAINPIKVLMVEKLG
ncbi:hypothetical protein DPMN_056073 [Dreissena polymorpha]|uniref:Uncharacterized protein n=1 Tax=Dreissena polymorpha TaxID=45954 RepID=A0A9D4CSR2_DREPO|nr:hypothetical protein DPMN_056073 [Dreissena polymorpha]